MGPDRLTTVSSRVAQFISIHRPFEEDFNLLMTVMDNISTSPKAINEVEFERYTDVIPHGDLAADDQDRHKSNLVLTY